MTDAPVLPVLTTVTEDPLPAPLPPARGGRFRDDPRGWAKVNLFSSVTSSILTVVLGIVLAYGAFRAFRYVFITGRWDIVRSGMTSLIVGLNYPRDDASLARPWIALACITIIGGLVAGTATRRRGDSFLLTIVPWVPIVIVGGLALALTETATPKLAGLGVVVAFVVARFVGVALPVAADRRLWIVYLALVLAAIGGVTGLERGSWDDWGGLLLALYVAVLGIVVSFPFGVLLALGRRSKLPVVKAVCVGYIELIRGVPLITLLFAGDLALRFFLPEGTDPPTRVNRAVIMVILFSAAYIAEIVRGGLQAVPKGQLEAAHALSLGPIVTLRKIVLPQALRAVIPAIVGQFISLFKDTTLLTIIGLRELVGVAETVTVQEEFRNQGLLPEILAFVGLLFWVCCYSMSRASQRLEARMGVGVR
jgi:general L-amino acid transport system permease protein